MNIRLAPAGAETEIETETDTGAETEIETETDTEAETEIETEIETETEIDTWSTWIGKENVRPC